MRKSSVSICAVIAVRNEYSYLKILLPILESQGIDVAIVDNDSSDASLDLYELYAGKPIVAVESLAFNGVFSLSEQLSKKRKLYQSLWHDWLVHHDADEVLEHRDKGKSLRDAIQQADDAGFNALNFEEFTFIPEKGRDYSGDNYYENLLQYYFFEKHKKFLNRAWKREAQLNNAHLGGHILDGEGVLIYPENHVLRHYIALSEELVKSKYSKRVFDEAELLKGWHKDRADLELTSLELPKKSDYLFRLDTSEEKNFVRENPARNHFWYWGGG